MRVSWTTRRSNQSIVKEVNPEYLLEELMLKLKLQFLGHLIQRANSFEKTLLLGKIEGKRRKGYKKDLHHTDNHDGVITDLEPDILECEVKWALGSIRSEEHTSELQSQHTTHRLTVHCLWPI